MSKTGQTTGNTNQLNLILVLIAHSPRTLNHEKSSKNKHTLHSTQHKQRNTPREKHLICSRLLFNAHYLHTIFDGREIIF